MTEQVEKQDLPEIDERIVGERGAAGGRDRGVEGQRHAPE